MDTNTDELCVKVRVPGTNRMEVRIIQPGEGMAIGREPCAFHRDCDDLMEEDER